MAQQNDAIPMKAYKLLKSGDTLLFEEAARLSVEEEIYEVRCRVSIRLQLRPCLFFEMGGDGNLPRDLQTKRGVEWRLEIPTRGISTSVRCVCCSSDSQDTIIRAVPTDRQVCVIPDLEVQRVEFRVFNFPHFAGRHPVYSKMNGQSARYEREILESDDWRVELVGAQTTLWSMLNNEYAADYRITHVGQITRQDGQDFAIGDANELVLALHWFLSFCKGSWAGVSLPLGYSRDGTCIWESLYLGYTSSCIRCQSWFDPSRGEIMSQVFPGFLSRWRDPDWERAVARAIYWYTAGNEMWASPDGALVLAQAALELLSWTALVSKGGILSNDGFCKLPACDQISLFLSNSGIPTSVPPLLNGLGALCRERNWDTGPQALTEIRNSIVHPKKSSFSLAGEVSATYEVWVLGQWYLELALLQLFGYTGHYSNRLIGDTCAQQVSKVPWHSSPDAR